jgi:hypothetical protein
VSPISNSYQMEEPYYVKESHTQYHPNKGGASFLQTTPLGDSEPPQRVKWGVGWRSPTTVIALFLIGTITAIGHHYYYKSLDGKEVVSVKKSQWSVDGVRNSQE